MGHIGVKVTAVVVAAVSVALLAGVMVLQSFRTIRTPLDQALPQAVARVARDSELDALSEQIRLYDEILTQSARNYAFTQDVKWKSRYLDAEPVLDRHIKDAEARGGSEDSAFFHKIDEANRVLVLMEYRAIEAVDDGRPSDAQTILESDEYWHHKALYKDGLDHYSERKRIRAQASRVTATDVLAQAVEDTRGAAAVGQF